VLTLIKGADVYAPQPLGKKDLLICGEKIAQIADNIAFEGVELNVIDADGKILIPGLVDSLVHISGGGGEGSFKTRTPEMQLTDATTAGVTTVIGALGTDATTRSLWDLVAKTRALNEEGLSAYCYTGSYQIPCVSICADIREDIILVNEMIGVGEVAIADNRSSQPDMQMLAGVAAEARVAGMLSGKRGIVSIHVGESESQLSLLHRVVAETDIPATQFYPTHINRNDSLLRAGIRWTYEGGFIDFTTSTNEQFIAEGEIPAAEAVAICLQRGVSETQLTMSSDGNASLPVFNDQGELIGLELGKVSSLYTAFRDLVLDHEVPLPQALATVTKTPADILKLTNKGRIQVAADADLVLLENNSLNIDSVMCRGQLMVENTKAIIKGTFEQ
jgi:beta-aspartyl-dipeptidase (metallo-type)